jgi:hypothetical protein
MKRSTNRWRRDLLSALLGVLVALGILIFYQEKRALDQAKVNELVERQNHIGWLNRDPNRKSLSWHAPLPKSSTPKKEASP